MEQIRAELLRCFFHLSRKKIINNYKRVNFSNKIIVGPY